MIEMDGESAVIAGLADAGIRDLPDDTPTRELVDKALEGALMAWFDCPAQQILGCGVAAAISWLKNKERFDEERHLTLEAKVLFALANDPQRLPGLLAGIDPEDDLPTPVGLKDAWEKACAACQPPRDPVTAREL